MNDRLLAEGFATVLGSGDFPALSGLFLVTGTIFANNSGQIVNRPTLAIAGEYAPYLEHRKGTLAFEVRSRIGDESGGQHQALFEQLFIALLGAQGSTAAATRANQAAQKVIVKAAIAALGDITLIEYGPSEDAVSADSEGDDLRTVFTLNVIWKFTPAV